MFTFGGGFNASSLPTLASSVAQALSGLAAQAQTTWGKQHGSDGAHGNVTATSMRAGQLGASGFFNVNGGTELFPAPLDVPAGVTFIQVAMSPTFQALVYGIRQAGQRYGDVLFIGPSPEGPEPVFLIDRAHGSAISPPLGTEIAFEASLSSYTGPAPRQFWVNSPQSPVMLIYLPGRGTNQSDAWCIPQMIDSLSI
jgi:hypothetical protein